MRWIAVCVLTVVGMVELVLRLAFALVVAALFMLSCLVLVGLLLVDEFDVEKAGRGLLGQPFCFNLAHEIAIDDRQSEREISKLKSELLEARELLLER